MKFKTYDDAEEYFYEHFGSATDDPDDEETRFMNWVNDNDIIIEEE